MSSRRSSRRTLSWQTGLFLALAALLIWGVQQCTPLDILGGGGISETVTGDWIVVHFTSPRYPDDASGHTGGIDADLVALIDSAEESVDVAAYDLDLETVVDALIRAQRDEVQVRLVTDVANAEQEAIARLREAQIPVVTRPGDGWAIMHNKFVVVDEVWVWTGSWNLTENGTYRNNNNAVLIASRSVAENYTAEFEEMYSGLFGPSSPADTPHPIVNIQGEETETRVEIYFSPEDQVIDHILRTLSEARSHVRFMAFQFTSEELADALVDLKEDGIEVEGVMEARYAGSSYSQYDRLRSGGVNVLGDSNPYIMHHKVFIVDDQTVILGSYNFTGSAEENNDENVLIVHDPEVAAAFLTEFDDIFQDGEAVQP